MAGFSLWSLLCAVALVRLVAATHDGHAEDLNIYLQAGHDVLSGISPYTDRDQLPFTYPPFAAMLAAPLAALGSTAAWLVVLLGNLALVGFLAWVARHRLSIAAAWSVPAFLTLSPVWRTFELGQVNLLLAGLVVMDVVVLPRRWSGVLTGIAAAVKLTPAVVVLYFLARRDVGSAGRFVASCLVCTLGAALLLPSASVRYWGGLLFDANRVGGLAYLDNVSVAAQSARFGTGHVLAVVADAAVLAVCFWASSRAARRDDDLGAFLSIVVAGLFVSPVTWSHHWVWIGLIVAWLVSTAHLRSAAVAYVVFQTTPLEFATLPVVGAAAPLVSVLMLLTGASFVRAVLTDSRREWSGDTGEDSVKRR